MSFWFSKLNTDLPQLDEMLQNRNAIHFWIFFLGKFNLESYCFSLKIKLKFDFSQI
jgi:hypothetical protein